jgi:hypothetical protein
MTPGPVAVRDPVRFVGASMRRFARIDDLDLLDWRLGLHISVDLMRQLSNPRENG